MKDCHDYGHDNDGIVKKSRKIAQRIIKVGRNILVAHRYSLTISHFVVGDDNISFVGNHTYH